MKSEPGEDVKVELEEEEGVKMEPEEEAVKQETEGEGEQPSSMEMEVDEQGTWETLACEGECVWGGWGGGELSV